jgi:hypothetical protein
LAAKIHRFSVIWLTLSELSGRILSAIFGTPAPLIASVLLGRAPFAELNMPNNSEKVMPINSESDNFGLSCVIIWFDIFAFGDILRSG